MKYLAKYLLISGTLIWTLQEGIHKLVVVLKDDHPVEIDWIRFF